MSSNDARKQRRPRPRRWAVPVVAVLLAAVTGGTLLWTVRGHQDSDPAIPVAIVNADQPVTTGSGDTQKTIAAGRQLAANLSQPTGTTKSPLSWELMDAADAADGLQDGSLYGVLTIPAGFSAQITSTSGSSPQQAQLQLVTDQSASAAVAALTQLTVSQAAAALGGQSTSSYVDQMLQSMTSIHGSLASSTTSSQSLAGSSHSLADSSHSLASSSQTLASSSQTLASSSQTLASSSQTLASSSQTLAESTAQIVAGASSLDQGSSSLAKGAQTLSSGALQTATAAGQVASGSSSLAAAADKVDQGASATASGASTLATGAQGVSKGAAALSQQAADLAAGAAKVDTGADRLADGSAEVAGGAADLAAACPDTAGPAYCARVDALAKASGVQRDASRVLSAATRVQATAGTGVAKGAAGLATAGAGVATGADQLSTGASQLKTGTASLDAAAGQLATGATGVAQGTTSVATGAAQTSAGATSVAQGAAGLSSGSAALASGANDLAGGNQQLADGAHQLAGGNDQLATGSDELASGTGQLADGSDQLASGNDQLASGLASGTDKVPSYTDAQRDTLVPVVATPVGVSTDLDHPSTVAAALAPVVLALTLWLGTLMMFLTGSPVPTSAAWSQATATRRVMVRLLPAVIVGIVQAAVVLVLTLVTGVEIATPFALAGLCVLGAVAFAAVNQALVAALGGIGRMVSLAMVALQVAAISGLVPIETAPPVMQQLNGVLPLSQFAGAAGGLVLGGTGSAVRACLVLTAWAAVAVAVSVLATSRRTPELSAAARPAGLLDLAHPR